MRLEATWEKSVDEHPEKGGQGHIFRVGMSTVELDTVNTLKMQIPPP